MVHQGDSLPLMGAMPAGVSVRDLTPAPALDLARWLFLAAFILFLLDCAAALFVSGRWRQVTTTAAVILLVLGAGRKLRDGRTRADSFHRQQSSLPWTTPCRPASPMF